jgi:5'-nucleotidase / UDP-sugar diphosphatase
MNTISKFFILIFLISIFFSTNSNSEIIQVLHTNDLHSFFDSKKKEFNSGGYQNIKYLIGKFKEDAHQNNIRTIVMDGGDFMEGSIFYMANFGKNSFQMHNKLGYDFAVLGNHDFLMGTSDLNNLLGSLNLNFSYLSANISVPREYKHIRDKIIPYKVVEFSNIKVAIMGLTTSEILYSWRLDDGKIKDPITIGKRLAKKLKKKLKVDAVIALTHIGFENDKKLAKKSSFIDLIVGGHSHTTLPQPFYQLSKRNKSIPIVQAGKHGEFLGRLLIDVTKNGIKVVNYKLVPVMNYDSPDSDIQDFINQSYQDLYSLYGEDYLKRIVSFSDLKKNSIHAWKIWSFFVSDSMKESSQSDISIHQENMSSTNYPIGPISNFDILNSHPRWLDFKDIYGWKIYNVKLPGYLLKFMFKTVMNFGLPLSITGITFDWKKRLWGKYSVKNLQINGTKIKNFKQYNISLPEGVYKGAVSTSPLLKYFLRKTPPPSIHITESIKTKLIRDGGIGYDYFTNENNRRNLLNLAPIDRTYFPGN